MPPLSGMCSSLLAGGNEGLAVVPAQAQATLGQQAGGRCSATGVAVQAQLNNTKSWRDAKGRLALGPRVWFARFWHDNHARARLSGGAVRRTVSLLRILGIEHS